MNRRIRILAFGLLMGALAAACGMENPIRDMDLDDDPPVTPVNPTPDPVDPGPSDPEQPVQGTCAIMWDGELVSLGQVTFTQDSERGRLLVVEAAHSVNNGVAALPRFVVRLWHDDSHGLLVAGEYLFNGENGTSAQGQDLFPTEAYINTALPDGHGGTKGDYQWAWTNSEHYSTYDPATLTATLDVQMTFVDEAAYRQLVADEGTPADQEAYEQMVRRANPKVMRLQMANCRFTPASR